MSLLIKTIFLCLIVSTLSFAYASPSSLFKATGFASMSGGYENFVGAGTGDNNGEGVTVALGGGNHASGDLGDTFPWEDHNGGKLIGIGFNDMILTIAGKREKRVFVFEKTFSKKPESRNIARDLDITWSGGKITKLSMNVRAREVSDNYKPVRMKFVIHVKQGSKVVTKREAFAKFDLVEALSDVNCSGAGFGLWDCATLKAKAITFNTLLRAHRLKAPGLVLKERALKLDNSKHSYISIVDNNGYNEGVTLNQFMGGLEKSRISIIASRLKAFKLKMQYDYVALFPSNPKKCGYRGAVMYISGLLNKNQGILQRYLDKYFLRKFGSSAFFIDANGKHVDFKTKIYRNRKIKNRHDVARIADLRRVLGISDVQNYTSSVRHNFNPGSFKRRLITATGKKGCKYYGMLEIQR